MPEYLRERFGGQRIRIYLSCLALILSIFTKISADLFAGAIFIQQTIDQQGDEWMYLSILILLAIAAVFTITGGLTAVIWTDFVQTILMIVGAFILMGMSFYETGGYTKLTEDYFYAIPNNTRYSEDNQTNCGEPPSYAMHFFRSAKPGESDLPWPGMLFGITVSGIWYWCTDQEVLYNSSSAIYEVGGYNKLITRYFEAIPSRLTYDSNNVTCPNGYPPPYAMNLFRPIVGSDLPWTGIVFGLTIGSIWYWCTDQVIVQRTLSSKNMTYAKSGCVLAAALKFLPLFMLVFPGMASRVLYTDKVACVRPEECEKYCGSKAGCTNVAYVELVLNLLPTGLAGLMLAVMMAALMSSLTSIFNSSATIFSIDIWTRIRKQATDIELLIVGRVFVLFMVVVSVLWIPVIQNSANSQLFVYIQSISSFLSPPICAIYLLAIFWDRTTEPGAFWGLIIGLGIGLIRFVMEFAYVVPVCGDESEDNRPEIIKVLVGNVHYLHFGCILLVITLLVTVVVSLLTQPIPSKCLHRLTYWSRHSTEVRFSIREWRNESKPDDEVKIEPKPQEKNGVTVRASISSEHLPGWRRALNCVCGVDTTKVNEEVGEEEDQETPEEKAKRAAEFLKEKKPWTDLVDGSAILVMCLAGFMWGFYA
ncbi:hypothetical protein Pmani_033422 [Petrolisthes manimaculis]|uniref:Uncharacterized protein n=1 Tax=Petrolisthes manimaculis TaxID=1843537 RepID=A0AAE1TQ38_9EUCA|nr:hypothetical protein Pmani_033422 [Petrolisthes manimaculis]